MKRACALLAICVASVVAGAAPSPAGALAEPVVVVVGFDHDTPPAARRAAAEAAGATVTGRIRGLGVERWAVPASALPAVDAVVDWAEPDRTLHVFETPNDPLLARQWAYDKLRFEKAWTHGTGATSPVIVGVVDTGIQATHPDLEGRLVPGRDFVFQDDAPVDEHGHGTGVSGVVAANTDNREGIAGMSWGAKIMPLQACTPNGTCSMFAVAQAIVWATVHDADVINLSLGGAMPSCARALQAAAAFASARDVLLVAASGNSAQQGNPTNYPSACDGFMAVGATNAFDEWATFSGYGRHVSVAAPGAAIMTTWASETSPRATRGYATVDGTSFAAPHVAGLAALLLSQHPDWTPDQVRGRIEDTAVDLGPEGRDRWFGHGRIDVVKALAR